MAVRQIIIFQLFPSLGDGIYDRLTDLEVFEIAWGYKRKNHIIENVHDIVGKITDNIIKYSLKSRRRIMLQ